MTILVVHMIVASAENRPHMLDKTMYNSWQSCMLLYIKGKKNGRMMLESIENGPLVYLTVEENDVIRPKKYAELTEQEQLQDDCDVQATNIVLQGLPPDVYALVNHCQTAKDIWERVNLLMQGIELSYQERECKLYNEFDRFTLVKGESLHEYYLRFAQRINDMHTIGMTMQQTQLNNTLPSVPQNLYDTHLISQQPQAEFPRLDSGLVVPTFLPCDDPIACLNKAMAFMSTVMASQETGSEIFWVKGIWQGSALSLRGQTQLNNTLPSVPQNLYDTPLISQQPQAEFPQLDSGLVVPTFLPCDDPIACLNKAMAFMSTGRQGQRFSGTGIKGNATRFGGNNVVGQARVVECYNYQGEGHMARQCTQPKRPRNSAWFKENMLLVQTDDLDAYDLDCNDISSTKAILMANLLSYGSDILSETLSKHFKKNESLLTTLTVFKKESKEKENKYMDKEIEFEKKIKELDNIVYKVGQSAQTVHMLTKPQVFYDDTHKQALGYQNPFYLKKAQRIKPTLYDEQAFLLQFSNPISKQPVVQTTRVRMEAPSELPKVSMVKTSFQKLKNYLASFDKVVKVRTTPDAITEESWDIVHICVNSLATLTNYAKIEKDYIDEHSENLVLKAELAKKEQMVEKKKFEEVVLRCSRLENRNVNLELKLRHQKESFLNNISFNNQNSPNIPEIFKINEWQAKLDAKDVSIANLRKNIECLKGKNVIEKDATPNKAKVITPGMFKLDLEPLSPKWIPIGRRFTIEGNRCPLTRITSTNVVPPKNPLPTRVENKTTPHRNNPEMLKDVTDKSSSSRSKGVESNVSNNSKPSQTWGSNVSTAPSSSLVDFRKPDLSHLHVFGALCYLTNDSEDLGKLKPKADVGIFVGLGPQLLTPRTFCSRLVPNPPSPTLYVPPTKKDWDILFWPMFDEYFNPPPCVDSLVPVVAAPKPADSTDTPSSTINDQDSPSPSTSQTPQET
ncbi:hypothetical protein Tco_1505142 [Tanacetum coccineum]